MSTWPLRKLSAIADGITYGLTASAQSQAHGPQFLRITDIQDDKVSWADVPFCECTKREAAAFKLQAGDLVFARTGATTGKSFLIRSCPDEVVFASYLIRVRPGHDIDPLFLSHFFKSENYWSQVNQSARGAAQPGINATVLGTLRVPVPALDEQRRIAAILDQAEALRAKRRQALAKLDTLTQSLFRHFFDDPEVGNFPQQRLGDLLEFLTSGSRGWASHYADVGAKFLRIQNVRAGRLECAEMAYVEAPQTAEARRTKVVPGDVLLSITADLGRTAVVPAGIGEAYINQHLSILRSSRLNPEYLSSYLQSPGGRRQIMAKNREGVKAGLNFDDVRSVQIPIPLRPLQDAFSAAKASLEKQRLRLQVAGKALEALGDSLQHRAFRGEL